MRWLLGRSTPAQPRVSDEIAEQKLDAASNALVTARVFKAEAREVSDKIELRLKHNHLGEGLTQVLLTAKGSPT